MKSIENILSIVIPVYNVAIPLTQLLNEIKDANLRGIEYIFVDDGSVDGSSKIVDQVATQISNSIVLHQENQGLSAARNAGLLVASCEYLWFVDSDDLIDFSALQSALDVLRNERPDLLQFGYQDFEDSANSDDILRNFVQPPLKYDYMTGKDLFRILGNEEIPNYSCIHIVRKKIYTENDIKFPVGLTFEDIATTYRLILNSENVIYSNQVLYFYGHRTDSITNSYNPKSFIDIFSILKRILKDDTLVPRLESSSLFIDSVFVTALRRSFEVTDSNLITRNRIECESAYQNENFLHHGKRGFKTMMRRALIRMRLFDRLMQMRISSRTKI